MFPYGLALAVFVFLVVILWRRRHELNRAWQYRKIFHPGLYWSIVGMYALSGVLITFPAFGAIHVGMKFGGATQQILAGVGILSIGLTWVVARKLSTPIFEAHAVAHIDRLAVHSLWTAFWLPGIAAGLLPTLAA